MEQYKNLAGNSGVVAFEIGSDSIQVQFSSGSIYEYTDSSAGTKNIDEMKRLAQCGKGLSTFISRHVRDKYAQKLC